MSLTRSPAAIARACYRAALAAADPAAHVRDALVALEWDDRPVWLIAAGKASRAMTTGALRAAADRGRRVAGGIVVAPDPFEVPDTIRVVAGDHPVPRAGSLAASAALEAFVAALPADAVVHVLLSGGASAMLASPVAGLPESPWRDYLGRLLHAGLPIGGMNAVRKRLNRWGAGRLAEALAPRDLFLWLLSDVPGDDPATIGSGPCTPDPWTAGDIEALLDEYGLRDKTDPAIRAALAAETLKAGAPAFTSVRTTVVASNRTALDAIQACAGELGVPSREFLSPLSGSARAAGEMLGTEAMRVAVEWHDQSDLLRDEGAGAWVRPLVLFQGGETTVAIRAGDGVGGRSQEVALAAARMLDVSPRPVTLLAAGTDGVDGPTDAAGALVDETTWSALVAAGVDPAAALERHDSHPALDRAGALVRTGPTGSNVMDLVIAVVGRFGEP